MRVALTLLFLSMALFLPNVTKAAETAPAETKANQPAPERTCPKFAWYKRLGSLSLDSQAEVESSRRDRDGQYTYLNGGKKGYHFVAEITPGFSPGFYLHTGEPGTVVAEFSLMDPDMGIAAGPDKAQSKVSFFLGPDLSPGFEDGLATGGAAHKRVMEDGPDNGPDIGVRCGVTWRFN